MQFKVLTAIIASVFVTSVAGQAQPQIRCYSGGVARNCAAYINQFCAHAVANTYAPRDNMNRCFNNNDGTKCDLTVWNTRTTGGQLFPSQPNCVRALTDAMSRCPSGGVGQYPGAQFQFGIDPNLGTCTGDVGSGGSRIS